MPSAHTWTQADDHTTQKRPPPPTNDHHLSETTTTTQTQQLPPKMFVECRYTCSSYIHNMILVCAKSSVLRFSAAPKPSTLAVMSTVWLILSSCPPPSVPSASYLSTPTLNSCQEEAMNCIQGELGLLQPLLPPLLHHEQCEATSGYSQMLRKPSQNAAKQILPKRIQTVTMTTMRVKEVMTSQRKHQQRQRERGQQG